MKRRLSMFMVLCMLLTCVAVSAPQLPAAALEEEAAAESEGYPVREYEFSGEVVSTKTVLDYKLDTSILEGFKGQHPRLFVTADTLPGLREKLQTQYAEKFQWFLQRVDNEIATGAPEYYVVTSAEENWMRTPADSLSNISFAYLITQEEKYLEAAITFTRTLLSYPAWGRIGSSYENNGLAAAHALRAFALTYDWLYEVLPVQLKNEMLSVMKERGAKMHSGGWWTQSYLQNHLWNDRFAAAITAVAIYEECPESKAWMERAISDYNTVYRYLDLDGGSHEGMQYWNYGMESYLLFKIMARDIFGLDYTIDEWDKNTWKFPLYTMLGEKTWTEDTNHINYGDSARDLALNGIMDKVEYLATTYENGYAKWLSNRLYDYLKENNGNAPEWYYYLYVDDTLTETPPNDLPTANLFEGLGIVMSHSDWSGSEAVLGFRCGMNCGMESKGLTLGSSSGHVHPDVNAPVLAAYGEYLLRDDGYGTTSRRNHSVLYIDGSGQVYKPGAEFLKESVPHIDKYIDTEDYTYAACDGTDAYGAIESFKAEFQLEKWIRHFLFLKKMDCLLVVDEIKTAEEKELELRWFPESTNLAMQGTNSSIIMGTNAQMKITTMDTIGDTRMENREVAYSSGTRAAVCIGKTGSDWTTATAITWSDMAGLPRTVTSERSGDDWTFRMGASVVTLNTQTYAIELEDWSDDIQIMINKKRLKSEVPPAEVDGVQYMPLKPLMTALGYKVEYKAETNTVGVVRGKNSWEIPLSDTPAEGAGLLVNDRTMITPQQMEQFFGIIAYYDLSNNVFEVKTKDFDTDASLSSVMLTGGELLGTEVGEDTAVATYLGEDVSVAPVMNSQTAVAQTKQLDKMQYEITVTAEDRKTTKRYDLRLQHPVALGEVPIKNVTAIGSDGNLPKNSVDGVSSSYWAYEQVGAWIVYEFDAEYRIDKAMTQWNKWNSRSMNFDLYTSTDGENWDLAGSYSSDRTMEFYESSFAPVTCKYVKLVGQGNSSNHWCSLTDIGFMKAQ